MTKQKAENKLRFGRDTRRSQHLVRKYNNKYG